MLNGNAAQMVVKFNGEDGSRTHFVLKNKSNQSTTFRGDFEFDHSPAMYLCQAKSECPISVYFLGVSSKHLQNVIS